MRVDKQEFVWEFSELSWPGQTGTRVARSLQNDNHLLQTFSLNRASSAYPAYGTIPKNIFNNFLDLERKVKLLSEENYELRERLLKKDAETEKLKTDGTKAQENIVNKILRKENNELHYEKEQLKLERDRLRHVVNEKQDKTEKLVAGMRTL